MPRDAGQFDTWYNKKEQEILVEKFGTTDKKELKKLMKLENLTLNSTQMVDANLTTDEKLKKVKLANETIKIWKEFKNSGFTPEQLASFVNDGEIPYENNKIFEDSKESKPVLTFGETKTHTTKKILQDDGTLRCLHCNRAIPMRAFDCEQIDDYKKHVELTHGQLEQEERSQLMELYPK